MLNRNTTFCNINEDLHINEAGVGLLALPNFKVKLSNTVTVNKVYFGLWSSYEY